MTIDLDAARQFVLSSARLLERHRLAVLLDHESPDRLVEALRPYQNPDGGFGHGLEPDLRGPESQVSSTLSAFEALAEVGAAAHDMAAVAVDWLTTKTLADGGVPTVLPEAADSPRAPWMEPVEESGFLTYAIAAHLYHLEVAHPWLDRATEWCWAQLEQVEAPAGYTVKFALDFLDAVPEGERAAAAVERLRPAIRSDGTLPVPGGVEGEHLTAIELSPLPGVPSRALFTAEQIDRALDKLEQEQLDDGGWDFGFLHWSLGQTVDWRGLVTLAAIRTLQANDRLD